jgi:hypothetical protein
VGTGLGETVSPLGADFSDVPEEVDGSGPTGSVGLLADVRSPPSSFVSPSSPSAATASRVLGNTSDGVMVTVTGLPSSS